MASVDCEPDQSWSLYAVKAALGSKPFDNVVFQFPFDCIVASSSVHKMLQNALEKLIFNIEHSWFSVVVLAIKHID